MLPLLPGAAAIGKKAQGRAPWRAVDYHILQALSMAQQGLILLVVSILIPVAEY